MIADIINSLQYKPRLVELGKVKIGGLGEARQSKSGGTYRIPRKDDHFTITTLNRAQTQSGARGDLVVDTQLMEKLMRDFGDKDGKLRSIPIRLLSDDIDDVLQSAWCLYGRSTCAARSDGKSITWYVDPHNGYSPLEEPKIDPFSQYVIDADYKGFKFKLHTIFNFVIYSSGSRFGGVYKFRTTSQITFNQLYASLVELTRLTNGILMNMPIMMKVRPIQVAPDGKATTVHVVHVELVGDDLMTIQKLALDQATYKTQFKQKLLETQHQYRALLADPGGEGGDEASEIEQEFHGEVVDPDSQVSELDARLAQAEARNQQPQQPQQPPRQPVLPPQSSATQQQQASPGQTYEQTDAEGFPVGAPKPEAEKKKRTRKTTVAPPTVASQPPAAAPAVAQAATAPQPVLESQAGAAADAGDDLKDFGIGDENKTDPEQNEPAEPDLSTYQGLVDAIGALAAERKVDPAAASSALRKCLVGAGMVGKEDQTSVEWRMQCLKVAREGRGNFSMFAMPETAAK